MLKSIRFLPEVEMTNLPKRSFTKASIIDFQKNNYTIFTKKQCRALALPKGTAKALRYSMIFNI
jgi:hypothetical protein